MRKYVLSRILLFISIAVLVSIGLSLFIFNFSITGITKNYIEEAKNVVIARLESIGNIDDIYAYIESQSDNAIDITVYSSDFEVIADTDYGHLAEADEDFLTSAVAGEEDYKIGKPYEVDSSMLMYAAKAKTSLDDGGYFIVRFSMIIMYNSKPFWLAVGVSLSIWGLTAAVAYFVTDRTLKSVMLPTEKIQELLTNIEKGEYHRMEVSTEFAETNNLIKKINDIGGTIADNIANLKYEQRKSNFYLQSINQGIIALSAKGRILLNNSAVQRIFAIENNIVGVDIDYLIKDEAVLESVRAALGDKAYISREMQVGDSFFRVETLHSDKYPLDFGGIEMIVLLTDVSQERKSADIRSEFFANASHELKTPLTAVMGYSELLLMGESDGEKLTKCAREIYDNAASMLVLINDMMRLSKLDAHIDDETPKMCDVGALAREAVQEQSVLAAAGNVSVSVTGEGSCVCRAKMIKTVVSNLVNNAIKYNRDGGEVKVSVSVDGQYLRLDVADTGIGIAPEHRRRLFERFYKVDTGRTRTAQSSTGLGLAIVKHTVLLHGGRVDVESVQGTGSKFSVLLPLSGTGGALNPPSIRG